MDQLLTRINQYIINPVLGFLFVLAFAYFLWGVVEYFLHQDNEEARNQGKQHIIWGIIGIFIMVSFYGIIRILAGTIGTSVPYP